MSATILLISLTVAQLAFALAMALCFWRMIRGPRAQDRVLALDAFYVAAMLQLLAFGRVAERRNRLCGLHVDCARS